MAIDFPNSPVSGDLYTAGGKTWQWNGTFWSAYGTSPVYRVSDTPPIGPSTGDTWYESDTGRLYIYTDSYWVEIGSAGRVTVSANDLTGPTLASNVLASSLTSVGTLGSLNVSGTISNSNGVMELGLGRVSNGFAYVDLISDTTYTDFGLRLIRSNSGANAPSSLNHRGTGSLSMITQEAAPIVFNTTNTERMRIDSTGKVGIGTASAATALDVVGAVTASTDYLLGTKSMPRGVMGYQNYTGGSFTATTTSAAITGISITFTAVTNRLYKATFTGECQAVTSAHRTTAIIKSGSTNVVEGVSYAGLNDYSQLTAIGLFTATGSTTMTVTAKADANTSIILGLAVPNNMVFIIEDIGAV